MEKFENGFKPPEQKIENPGKLTKTEVIKKLEDGENLENLIMADLDLAGLNFEGKSFCKSDIRGTSFYREEQNENGETTEIRTNIRGTDFTDAVIADLGPQVFFGRVDAEGATFGFSESLISRRKRHKESGGAPMAEDTGGLFGFNGNEGNFRKTKWVNANFGGGSNYEAIFPGADLSESEIRGCDLSGIDFSKVNIDNIKIIDPVSLLDMRINENQIESVVQGIQLASPEDQAEFLKKIAERGPRKFLEEYFGIIVAEIKD